MQSGCGDWSGLVCVRLVCFAMKVIAMGMVLAGLAVVAVIGILVMFSKGDSVEYCAMNLRSPYNTPSHNSVDYAIAHAFYRHGVDMNRETRGTLLGEIQNVLPQMTDDDIGRSNNYYVGIQRGDFSQIPHVKDARPVLP